MVVQPNCHHSRKVTAKASFFGPPFEVKRARLLVILFSEPMDVVPGKRTGIPTRPSNNQVSLEL